MQEELYLHALQGTDILTTPIDDKLKNGFNRFTRCYTFTNEDLIPHLEAIDFQDKNVLGIVGSGDHMICSLAEGCNSYLGVDVSIYSPVFTELKLSALRNLDFEDFKKFFGWPFPSQRFFFLDEPEPSENENYLQDYFSRETYQNLREELNPTPKHFFDNVIGNNITSENRWMAPLISKYICQKVSSQHMGYIPYLRSEADYKNVRWKIGDRELPLMFPMCISEAISHLDGEYDILYLSNALEGFNKENRIKILEKLKSHKSPDGVFVIFSNRANEWLSQYSADSEELKSDNRDYRSEVFNVVFPYSYVFS